MNTDETQIGFICVSSVFICVHLCSSVAEILMKEPTTINWPALRVDFPVLDQQVNGRPLIYFDNAATTQKPRAVVEALQYYYEHDNANVHRGIHELSNRATAAFEGARTRSAGSTGWRGPAGGHGSGALRLWPMRPKAPGTGRST